jgi:hypothetical protein
MRVLTIVGVALVIGVAAASAQHGHQLELGGFATYTRYDPVFGLKRQLGGGGRLGYFMGDYFGLELDANLTSPVDTSALFRTKIGRGSVSLIVNSGGEHNILYVLGGYTRARLGTASPYTWLNQVHGGIGDRIFFGSHVALRLEARAYYTPGDQAAIGKSPLDIAGSAGLSLLLGGRGGGGDHGDHEERPVIAPQKRDSIIAAGGTPPPEKREKEAKPSRRVFVQSGTGWARQWFWGAQGGVMIFKTAYDGISAEPTLGGHWLITAKKTAMYVAYEQSFFITDRHATIVEPNGTIEPGNIAFKGLRRIMMGVLAFPVQKAMQPYGGVGFAIVEILNPRATCTGCSLNDAVSTQIVAENYGTKGVFWWMGGLDIRQGRLSLYGHYILTSSPRSFLISGVTHTVQGGIRYSLGNSREGITDQH